MDAGPHTRGSGREAASGGRLGHGGPESRRSPRRPPPRRARSHRDRRPSRGGSRATDREPDPVRPDAARPAAPRPSPRLAHRGAADPPPRPGSGRPRAARRGGPLPVTIRDRAAIVGIGQTPFAKHLGRSEYDMAVEAILAACDDAGISPRAIDGVVRYDMETTDEENLLAALGNPEIRYQASTSWGGGGSVSVLVHAAVAIAAGMADTVLVYRSRARGKTSVFGKDALQGGRYWERLADRLSGLNQWHVPHGLVSAFQEMAMITRRHMIDYGTTEDHFAEVA